MDIQSKPPRTAAEEAVMNAFNDRLGDLPGDAAVALARDRLVSEFGTRGLPTRRLEAWHYTDMRSLMRALPDSANGVAATLKPLVQSSAVLAVVQGEAGPAKTLGGFQAEPFRTMLESGTAAAMLDARDEADSIGRLNGAFVTDGYGLVIADDADVAGIVELQAIQNGGHAHTRFPARFGRKAKATVIERQAGNNERQGFSTSVSEIDLGEGAEINWIIVQERGEGDIHLGQFKARLGAQSRLNLFVINAGGKLVRQEIHIDVAGEGAHFNLRGINLLAGDSHTDVTLTLGHNVANTTSSEIVRNVVLDRARGVFQGQINVAQIAQKTDAQMACNTLLLSDDGEFSAKPELEIFADDVICAHGATVIDIDRNHLFYLMARGISEKSARTLLVNGFVDELIDELDDELLVGALETLVEQWLVAHG